MGIFGMNLSKKILIIDDDERILTSLQDILAQEGYILSIASNGKEGLKKCETGELDLIITDIIMPDIEGIELIRAIRRGNVNIPIIAMSGDFIGQKFLKAARLFGAIDTLLKPFSAKELKDKINRALSR